MNQVNPAFQPEAGSLYIGFPLFSSIYLDGGVTARGATLNSLAGGNPNIRKIAENVGTFEGGHAKMELNLLNVGVLVRDMYFTFDVITKAYTDLSVPGSLIEMAWYGNAPTMGKAVSLEGLGGQMTAYTEFSFGFSKEVLRDRITVGGKLKYLAGHSYAELYLGPNSYVYTDPDTWNITTGLAPNLYFAGLPIEAPLGAYSSADANFRPSSFSPTSAGSGVGIDLGFEIKGERFTTSGSLTNIGLISWKNADYVQADGGYQSRTFQGVSIGGNGNMLGGLGDSLIDMRLHSYTLNPLRRWTDPTMQFSVSYKLHENFYAGALVGMNISKYNTYPLLALSASTRDFPINGALSYSYSHSHNLGMGVVFGRRGAQLHVIFDNVLAASYRSVRQANLRLGLSLLTGGPKNTDPQKQTWELMSPTEEEAEEEKKAARAARKEKRQRRPLNQDFGPTTTQRVNKSLLNSAPPQGAVAPKRRTYGTLSTPAGQGQPRRQKVKMKPLN
ncbi:MAG: DUF5723 family protein [Prevotellaceae bacterium]|nr:DUF5723 family protein [Prevotellaceae bacterium]